MFFGTIKFWYLTRLGITLFNSITDYKDIRMYV
jgi:hypothetical protein